MKSQQDKINANTLRDNLLSANVSAVDENYKNWRGNGNNKIKGYLGVEINNPKMNENCFTIEQMFVLSEVCND